jgi:hypothetical protein
MMGARQKRASTNLIFFSLATLLKNDAEDHSSFQTPKGPTMFDGHPFRLPPLGGGSSGCHHCVTVTATRLCGTLKQITSCPPADVHMMYDVLMVGRHRRHEEATGDWPERGDESFRLSFTPPSTPACHARLSHLTNLKLFSNPRNGKPLFDHNHGIFSLRRRAPYDVPYLLTIAAFTMRLPREFKDVARNG